MLPFALHGYRTMVRTSTEATPFSLVYGMEVVLPLEVEIPSLRVLVDVKLDEAEWITNRLNQLSLMDEKRLASIAFGRLYQSRMKKAYDKKVRPRSFQTGDLVLKKILPPHSDHRGSGLPITKVRTSSARSSREELCCYPRWMVKILHPR